MIVDQPQRAYLGADNEMAVYLRTDAGRRDMSGAEEIKALVKRWNGHVVAEVEATGDANGRVAFTVTQELGEQQLAPGTFALQIVADGEVVATGTLEVVG